tara:strand:- start:12778 stop:13260 length:483 start_codon:yes stop_codon:yes gene_type:complete
MTHKPDEQDWLDGVRELAHETILKCKDGCYSSGRKAGNELEGDYGSWQDWEDVLVSFADQLAHYAPKEKCSACDGDGKMRCNNPDHEFDVAIGGEANRLGCPTCDYPRSTITIDDCDVCDGTGIAPKPIVTPESETFVEKINRLNGEIRQAIIEHRRNNP